jgi:tryptophan halogenase
MKNLIVLGGGAAGWLTAIFAKKLYPQNKITLIESEKIGILGAGEGSTPHLPMFLDFLDINIFDLINKTKGTLKYGINFENWNGDKKKYFHGFNSINEFNKFAIKNSFKHECYDKYLHDCVSKNLNLNEYLYGSLLVDNKKVDIYNENFSLHFDAHKIAKYLKELAIERGVLHVEGEVNNLLQDEKGNIICVNLQDTSKHYCDFIFDCSGFKRLIIGKTYKTPWIDYQKHLPMKKAVPFFLEQEEEIMPCTHAIAMKYGWIWKIPLQHRFGSGYIFDSDFINPDQALQEAEEQLGYKLDSPRVISFDAGRFENVWVKNCIAVGLSAGFTEPLEATSLYIAVQQLMLLAHYKDNLFDISKYQKKDFNIIMENTNDEILAFLYLHYLTKRDDSDFWRNFRNNTTPPKSLIERLESLKEGNFIPFSFDLNKSVAGFQLSSFIVVSHGLGLIEKKLKPIEGLYPNTDIYQKNMIKNLSHLNGHRQFLESLNVCP